MPRIQDIYAPNRFEGVVKHFEKIPCICNGAFANLDTRMNGTEDRIFVSEVAGVRLMYHECGIYYRPTLTGYASSYIWFPYFDENFTYADFMSGIDDYVNLLNRIVKENIVNAPCDPTI